MTLHPSWQKKLLWGPIIDALDSIRVFKGLNSNCTSIYVKPPDVFTSLD